MNTYLLRNIPYLFLLFSFLVNNSVNAQDFKSGSIITSTNDTIQGIIQNSKDYIYSQSIYFKNNVGDSYKHHSPNELKGFILNTDQVYVSKQVQLQANQRTLFLKELVSGYVSLYMIRSEIGTETFFFQKRDSAIVTLRKEIYLGILGAYLSKCSSITYKANSSTAYLYQYDQEHLIRLIKIYNECVKPNEQVIQRIKPKKIIVYKGLKIGVNQNNLSFKTNAHSYYKANFKAETSILAGIYFDIVFNKRWSIQPEILFTQKKASLVRQTTTPLYEERVKFNISYIQIPVLAKYSYLNQRLRSYLMAGPNLNYAIHTVAESRMVSTDGRNTQIASKQIDNFKFSPGYTLGVGLEKPLGKRYRVNGELRFDKNIDDYIRQITWQLVLGFSI